MACSSSSPAWQGRLELSKKHLTFSFRFTSSRGIWSRQVAPSLVSENRHVPRVCLRRDRKWRTRSLRMGLRLKGEGGVDLRSKKRSALVMEGGGEYYCCVCYTFVFRFRQHWLPFLCENITTPVAYGESSSQDRTCLLVAQILEYIGLCVYDGSRSLLVCPPQHHYYGGTQ